MEKEKSKVNKVMIVSDDKEKGVSYTPYIIEDTSKIKSISSANFHHVFNKETGFAITYGKTQNDDPTHCPIGPLIADIEITTICHGVRDVKGNRAPCKFCYKSNTPNGINMSFETFKKIFDKLPKTLTQIAFGADAQANSNPDLIKIMEYTRANDVVPNITVADVDDEMVGKLSKLVGAVAVSNYPDRDKNICYNLVEKFVAAGITQTNIHQLVATESFDGIMQLLEDCKTDKRLAELNAIVLLSLKPKGRGVGFTKLSKEKFKIIVDTAFKLGISIGFDSCSCQRFIKAVIDDPKIEEYRMMAEPCESFGMFSCYINAEGIYYPCSFAEGEGEWKDGINVVECNDFIKDIWYHPLVNKYREIMIKNGRNCPIFEIE